MEPNGSSPESTPTVKRPLFLLGLGGAFPFFASALFFLSGFLSLFSALPLMLLFWRYPRRARVLGLLTNAVLVVVLSKWSGGWDWSRAAAAGIVFFSVVAPVVLFVPDWIFKSRWSVSRAGGVAWLGSILLLVAAITGWSRNEGVMWGKPLRGVVHGLVQQLVEVNRESGNALPWGDVPPDVVEKQILLDMPSGIAISVLVLVWISMVSIIRVVPVEVKVQLGMDPLILSRWRAPDLWVWPTLVSGALLLRDFGHVTDLAYSALRITLAVYVLQGLSVLAFGLDRFRIRGIIRSLVQGVAVFGLLPIVLGMGFFDLWFDFRARFKQNS